MTKIIATLVALKLPPVYTGLKIDGFRGRCVLTVVK